ncbi:MAG: sulfotransferase [Pseudomonadota bacterium]
MGVQTVMQAAQTSPTLQSIQEHIVAHQYDAALLSLEGLSDELRESVDALYLRAVCERLSRRFDDALATLERLKRLAPEHARAHQEEGHALRDAGADSDALFAYQRATRLNPALVASWKQQHRILSATASGDLEARQVAAQLDYLQQLAPPLVSVIDLIGQGAVLKAEDLCRRYLQKSPRDTEAMRLLADIGLRLGVLDDAEFLLRSARSLDPSNVRVRIDYIQILRKRQKFAAALEEARLLLATAPNNPQFQSIHAIECMQTGDYADALALFDAVLATLPNDPVTLTSKGHAFKTMGQYDDAVAAYRAAIASAPQHGEAYYALANLKVYEFSDAEMEAMHARERGANSGYMDRVHLSFALGKAHEDRGDYKTAFEHYVTGNGLKKAQSRYDAERMAEDFAAQRTVCTRAFFDQRSGYGHDAPDPIFILGLPRAGSTLLEQILASHSQVDGTLELPNILSLSQSMRRAGRDSDKPPYPDILETLSSEDFERHGIQFIEDTRIHRQDAPSFIDKMPNNFRHIGLIHLMLPNARIIDARRHPMACCFSGFKQLFAEGQEFTYDLSDVGQYYRDYVSLMDHWDAVLPGKILRVNYEDVVADIETQVRRILDHCGLEFETACVDFYRNKRSVRTPSSEQVRQPIYTTGLEEWRHFEPWLGPLKSALGSNVRERYEIASV